MVVGIIDHEAGTGYSKAGADAFNAGFFYLMAIGSFSGGLPPLMVLSKRCFDH